jgi:hypothetical protein
MFNNPLKRSNSISEEIDTDTIVIQSNSNCNMLCINWTTIETVELVYHCNQLGMSTWEISIVAIPTIGGPCREYSLRYKTRTNAVRQFKMLTKYV